MSLDGTYQPFSTMAGYASLNPCVRSCDFDVGYNGCDLAKCWCNKGNLDLRMSSMGDCMSTSCTFSFMNTATDITTMSYLQIEYCSAKGYSPAGLTVPSTAPAAATGTMTSGTKGPATGSQAVLTTAVVTGSQTILTVITSQVNVPSTPANPSDASNSNSLSTPVKAGIGIGAAFVILLAILICVLISMMRRKKRNAQLMPTYPAPYISQQGFQPQPGGRGPVPPAMNQPGNLTLQTTGAGMGMDAGGVSPLEEKPFYPRKAVGSSVSAVTASPSMSIPAVSTVGMQQQRQYPVATPTPPPPPATMYDPPASGNELQGSEAVRREELDAGLANQGRSQSQRSELPAYYQYPGNMNAHVHELGGTPGGR